MSIPGIQTMIILYDETAAFEIRKVIIVDCLDINAHEGNRFEQTLMTEFVRVRHALNCIRSSCYLI